MGQLFAVTAAAAEAGAIAAAERVDSGAPVVWAIATAASTTVASIKTPATNAAGMSFIVVIPGIEERYRLRDFVLNAS